MGKKEFKNKSSSIPCLQSRIAIFEKSNIKTKNQAPLLMRGWTTNEFVCNYKSCNLWGRKSNTIQLHTLDWSINLLTNNMLAILVKEKKNKKERKKAKKNSYNTCAHLIVDLDCYAWKMLYQVL